jgi:hypothetical protein
MMDWCYRTMSSSSLDHTTTSLHDSIIDYYSPPSCALHYQSQDTNHPLHPYSKIQQSHQMDFWLNHFFYSFIHLWVILSFVCDWDCNFFIHMTILWYRSTILLVLVFTLILYIEHISKHIITGWLRDHGYIEKKVVIVLLANHDISVFTCIRCIEHISKHITTRWLQDHGLYREEGSIERKIVIVLLTDHEI